MTNHLPKLSVQALQQAMQACLKEGFQTVCVFGEVSNCFVSQLGHCYFTLKDSHSEIKCVFFKVMQRGQRVPQDGDAIQVVAQPNIYIPRGTLQLTIQHYMPHGVGALLAQYQQLKQTLSKEGLFESERKQILPNLPESVGVITSPQGDALIDIIRTLRRRSPWVKITVYGCQVQGATAHTTIIDALTRADQAKHDVLIISRGGGSIEDLWPFNEATLAYAIDQANTPIITGIGHAKDESIADLCADQIAPTPTAAAEMLAPSKAQIQQHFILSLKNALQQLHQRFYILNNLQQRTVAQLRDPIAYITQAQQTVDQQLTQNQLMLDWHVRRIKAQWQDTVRQLKQHPLQRIHQTSCTLLAQWIQGYPQQLDQIAARYQYQLTTLQSLLKQHDPDLPLQKGYAYIENASQKNLKVDAQITLKTLNQRIQCLITEIREKNT